MSKTKNDHIIDFSPVTQEQREEVILELQKVKEIVQGHVYACESCDGSEIIVPFMQKVPEQATGDLVTVGYGLQTEQLLMVLLHRLEAVNAVVPCQENEDSYELIQAALTLQIERRARRKARGVEGTRKA